jgi:hypothetical protein
MLLALRSYVARKNGCDYDAQRSGSAAARSAVRCNRLLDGMWLNQCGAFSEPMPCQFIDAL